MTSRYVRLHRGQIVVQRHDLQGVVAHLHDLARHLEGLVPDKEALANLMRARDFSGGMALRAEYERELDAAVLEALADRSERAPYVELSIEGYASEQIDAAVYRLWRQGLVDAHSTKPERVRPSALTTKGFRALEKLGRATLTAGRSK